MYNFETIDEAAEFMPKLSDIVGLGELKLECSIKRVRSSKYYNIDILICRDTDPRISYKLYSVSQDTGSTMYAFVQVCSYASKNKQKFIDAFEHIFSQLGAEHKRKRSNK